MKIALVFLIAAALASAQRITTIQLDGVQYFVSRMNPYSPELNYFLAYQYCRSLGLQLASFETKEKADTMSQYLKNAGYTKFDFWTSGNKLGTDMFLWMSTGLPFNATFDNMRKRPGHSETDVPPGTEPQRVARESGESGNADGCVAMKAPTLEWEAEDCTLYKDFICEQTRCYYYNYGSIPVSATQGTRRPYVTSTTAIPVVENDHPHNHHHHQTEHTHEEGEAEVEEATSEDHDSTAENNESNDDKIATPIVSEDPIVNRLVTAIPTSETLSAETVPADATADEALPAETDVAVEEEVDDETKDEGEALEQRTSPDHGIPDIASLFTPRKDSVFDGLETREVRRPSSKTEEVPVVDYENVETELPNNALEDARTIGPYDGTQQDYPNDQPAQDEPSAALKDEDSSTILPEAEPAYRYNIKVRSNGKVLDPPSK